MFACLLNARSPGTTVPDAGSDGRGGGGSGGGVSGGSGGGAHGNAPGPCSPHTSRAVVQHLKRRILLELTGLCACHRTEGAGYATAAAPSELAILHTRQVQ